LENAKKLGADLTIDFREVNLLLNLKEITKGKFVDFSFEAVGFSNSAFQSLIALKKCGTAVWVSTENIISKE
jgi:NADPH:quinone reductase-like Zn-dependent oxidoreductase